MALKLRIYFELKESFSGTAKSEFISLGYVVATPPNLAANLFSPAEANESTFLVRGPFAATLITGGSVFAAKNCLDHRRAKTRHA
jgi:hypothetical protein